MLRVECDNRINLEFHGAAVTSDMGLFTDREIDEALELTEMAKLFAIRAAARTRNTSWSDCCGNRCTVVSQATRIRTTWYLPSGRGMHS